MDINLIKEDEILDSFDLKSELNPDIFDRENKEYAMKSDIRKTLLVIADEFLEFLGVHFFIHDVVLTGSLANYNWSKFSDLDLHILIDFEETNYDKTLLKEFFDSKKMIWNSQYAIMVKGFDVEIYVQDVAEKHESTGVYSVLNDKWLLVPHFHEVKIDKSKIKTKVDWWIKIIDDLTEHKDDEGIIDKVNKVRDKLKKFRQSGLEKGGEYSYENLTFKYLRRNDYIKKLLDLKNEILDKHLSLEQSPDIYNK